MLVLRFGLSGLNLNTGATLALPWSTLMPSRKGADVNFPATLMGWSLKGTTTAGTWALEIGGKSGFVTGDPWNYGGPPATASGTRHAGAAASPFNTTGLYQGGIYLKTATATGNLSALEGYIAFGLESYRDWREYVVADWP